MTNKWRILVVEDDPDGQAVVGHILQYMNIEVDIAGDAEQAGQFLFENKNTYHAIVIDLALPGKDGWELLSEIQNDPRTVEWPCIAVTAFHTSKLREEAIMAGFTAYFAKPIDATTFLRELESILA